MKLTKEQFIEKVNLYEKMFNEETEICGILEVDWNWRPSKWLDAYYTLLSDMCELEDSPSGTALDWFCFETKFGKSSHNFATYETPTGKVTMTIPSPEKLWDYLKATGEI